MVFSERDRARRNRQRFQQLLNEIEQQDRDLAEQLEEAGVDEERLAEARAEAERAEREAAERQTAPTTPSLDLQGFVVRG